MRVVISMTTIPPRAESLLKTIHSLLAGTVTPDTLHVNIPRRYARFAAPFDPDIQRALGRLPRVQVNVIEDDHGTLDKIVPTLDLERDGNTLIAIADDDAAYQPLFLQGLVQGYHEFATVVGYSGLVYPEKVLARSGFARALLRQQHGCEADLLEGSFGVLFPRWCFEGLPSFPPMTAGDTDIHLADDYVFARFLDARGIDKRVVNFDAIGRVGDDWSSILATNEGSQHHSLAADGNLERYLRVARRLDFRGVPPRRSPNHTGN